MDHTEHMNRHSAHYVHSDHPMPSSTDPTYLHLVHEDEGEAVGGFTKLPWITPHGQASRLCFLQISPYPSGSLLISLHLSLSLRISDSRPLHLPQVPFPPSGALVLPQDLSSPSRSPPTTHSCSSNHGALSLHPQQPPALPSQTLPPSHKLTHPVFSIHKPSRPIPLTNIYRPLPSQTHPIPATPHKPSHLVPSPY